MIFFESPYSDSYRYPYYDSGNSPALLQNLLDFLNGNLEEITEVNLAMFLFNNPVLYKALREVAARGIPVNIISIPLEGYDDRRPKTIYSQETQEQLCPSATKYQMARMLYQCYANEDHPRIRSLHMFQFPHIYVRSSNVRQFSRGVMPYSLHTKSIFIKMRNQPSIVGLTSSNMAVADARKHEFLYLTPANQLMYDQAETFFHYLIANSQSIAPGMVDADGMHYDLQFAEWNQQTRYALNAYLAPFLPDSPFRFERAVKHLIHTARRRIYICAEHIAAYSFNNGQGHDNGFLDDVMQMAERNPEIDIRCLSQTFVGPNMEPYHGSRVPQNKSSFARFIEEYQQHHNCQYGFNINIHAKYILADDAVILTTCNFTPTQFYYKSPVTIESFDFFPRMSYHGTFSEVGQYIYTNDMETSQAISQDFLSIWENPETVHYNPQEQDTAVTSAELDAPLCPCCHDPMIRRKGKYGQFWGCRNYPRCKETLNI